MSITNMASFTQTIPAQQGYAPHTAYMQHGASGAQYQQHHQPRLMYFITRTNGSIVPLIPVDELPYSVRLESAPRNLTPEQTFGLQFLGSLPYTGMIFKAKEESTAMQRVSSEPGTPIHCRQYSNGKQYMAPDALARQATTNAAHHSQTPSDSSSAQYTTPFPPVTSLPAHTPPLTDPQAIIDAIISSKTGAETAARIGYVPRSVAQSSSPSGKIPDANKKTHCSYWIRTGECDYAQQGCMYKHEMPDEKGLLELGFRTTPRWWAEKNQAIKLGSGNGGKKATVGPVVKPSEWLRKQSLASTESAKSQGSDTETESVRSKGNMKSVKGVAMADKSGETAKVDSDKATRLEKQITILQKPETFAPSAIKTANPGDAGDLIDFGISTPSTSSPKDFKATTPTSVDSSPGPSPAEVKTTLMNTGKSVSATAKEVFVPKGESKTQHLAKHASHHLRSIAHRPMPSEAQVASLEKQIEQAQNSKHIPSTRGNRSDGLMASRHAYVGIGRAGEGRKGGRTTTGVRVRRSALQCKDIPTGKKVREKAEAEGKE